MGFTEREVLREYSGDETAIGDTDAVFARSGTVGGGEKPSAIRTMLTLTIS